MSKAVLISIRPKWCEKIAQGEKTVEVRKTRPKLETPFRCYIYCTKARERLSTSLTDGDENYGEIYRGKPVFIKTNDPDDFYAYGHSCAVIGEFVCDRIFPIDVLDNGSIRNWNYEHMDQACLSYEDLVAYIGVGKRGFGWHLSDLKIYDDLKYVGEFPQPLENCKSKTCDEFGCLSCEHGFIKRPPQSWCYVEELSHE